MKPTIIVSTYPDKKSIIKISNELIKTKIVACVNISKISSIYAWHGKIENTSEYLALFKTTHKNKKILKEKIKILKEKIKSTHPYDVPEIAEISVNSINRPYLDWLIDSTT
jgi:periplasmic divalent cation tolerance protein